MSEDDMTDRELLELAAKAAGIKYWVHYDDDSSLLVPYDIDTALEWNPLSDDGDALRLAVKCGMVIDARYGNNKPHKNTTVCVMYWINPEKSLTISENAFENFQAATRKCIVRAAAEIGKQLQS